jgi:hypothetical protein
LIAAKPFRYRAYETGIQFWRHLRAIISRTTIVAAVAIGTVAIIIITAAAAAAAAPWAT